MKRYANGKSLSISLFLAAILFCALVGPALAAEGAASSYTPGTYGEFSMNYAQPGVYVRENVVYVTGTVDNYPYQPGIEFNLDQTTWFNLLAITYVSEKKLLGGNYFCVANIPYGFSAEIDVDVEVLNQPFQSTEDRASGLGDIQVTPIGLMWHSGYFHFTLAENVVLKTGEYDANEAINMGRNYYSYETLFGMTWLHEKGGHEISFLAGYMLNEKNKDTDYRTGDEFHIDATVAQYFSESFGIGVVGYYYKQMTDDESPNLDLIDANNPFLGLPAADGYRSEGAGMGPALMWSPAKNFQIIAKWITEFGAENRFEGDWGFLSANIKF